MNAKDSISLVALCISVASFGLSLWVYTFNRHVKGAELRAQLLVKIADSKNNAFTVQEYLASAARDARDSNDAELQSLDNYAKRLKASVQELEKIYAKVCSAAPRYGVKLFADIFHDVHDINTQINDFKIAIERTINKHLDTKRISRESKA